MDFIKRHKRAFIGSIAAICLISIIISIAYQYKPSLVEKGVGFVVTPIQGAMTNAGRWFGGKINSLTHLSEIESENTRLKAQLAELEIENSRLKFADQQALELSNLLNVDRKYSDYKKIGAQIIAKDPGNWYDTFIIDKGSDDGLAANMVVLASGGLAGRITKIGKNYARVVTLIDDTSSISAKGARTGDTGFVRGDAGLMLEGKCKMEYITADAEIVAGDEIVTSHISSIYPPNLTIGYVLDVSVDTLGTKTATVQPVVDFRYLDTVLVITELFDHELIDEEDLKSKE